MQKLKVATHVLVLATTPLSLVCPESTLSSLATSTFNYQHEGMQPKEKTLTYDQILNLLSELESGELEEKSSPEDLERINQFVAFLAQEGSLSDDPGAKLALEEDVEDLLSGEENLFEFAFSTGDDKEHIIVPFNGYSRDDIVRCGLLSKSWKKTKKFVKKHKKEIIIGAVVVVAVAAVTIVVIAGSSAGAATAAGGAAGAAALDSEVSSESKEESPSLSSIPKDLSFKEVSELPMMKEALDKEINSFKEFIVEDTIAQQKVPHQKEDAFAFGEKAREFGSNLTHQLYDAVDELIRIAPELLDGLQNISSKLLPDSLRYQDAPSNGTLMENYEYWVAQGHKAIDTIFSTDQAKNFTPEAKANKALADEYHNLHIGILPPPGRIPKIFSNTKKLTQAGNALDRAGFTKAGRSLMKHGYRRGSAFPKPLGNSSQVNAHGQKVLKSIVNNPERVLYERTLPSGNKVIDIVVPNQGGVRFTLEGKMLHFLEP